MYVWVCIDGLKMHRNVLLAALGSFVHIISVNGLEMAGVCGREMRINA